MQERKALPIWFLWRKEMEEHLAKRNHYGNKDLTAYNAVQQIRTKGKAEITLR